MMPDVGGKKKVLRAALGKKIIRLIQVARRAKGKKTTAKRKRGERHRAKGYNEKKGNSKGPMQHL